MSCSWSKHGLDNGICLHLYKGYVFSFVLVFTLVVVFVMVTVLVYVLVLILILKGNWSCLSWSCFAFSFCSVDVLVFVSVYSPRFCLVLSGHVLGETGSAWESLIKVGKV